MGAITDIYNNSIETIPVEGAKMPTFISMDTMRPELEMFSIDLTNGNLTLFFSEAPDVESTDLSQLTLQSDNTLSAVQFALTGGIVEPHAFVSSALSIELNTPDINEIYRLDLCTATTDCFLSYTDVLVHDYAGNMLVGRNESNALNVSMYEPDFTMPELLEFTLFDLGAGTMTLRFSETVMGRINKLSWI